MCAGVCVAILVLLASGLLQAKEKEYVGAKTCGTCHPDQLAQQSGSEHAHALHVGAEHPLAKSFAPAGQLLRKPNFTFRFSNASNRLQVSVSDGKASETNPVQWAFGAGDQAVTFVSQLNEDWYVEHHFSYYASTRSLLPTPGHENIEAASLPEALGVLYRTFDPEPKIMRCFKCHSTGRLSLGLALDLLPAELGVRCEACHGPGSLHVEAAQRGERAARDFIENPRRLSAGELNNFCGVCHRQPAPAGGATNWSEPWNVRHQPLYLNQSMCFQKSRGGLSCHTCHDPHAPLVKNASYYNGRCSSCHKEKPHPRIARRADDCIGCHMPRVSPQPHLAFTNHWIGIYRAGAVLRPLR